MKKLPGFSCLPSYVFPNEEGRLSSPVTSRIARRFVFVSLGLRNSSKFLGLLVSRPFARITMHEEI